MTQDKLAQWLGDAGFQKVRVIDAAYGVRAKGPQGDDLVLFINPPAIGTGEEQAAKTKVRPTRGSSPPKARARARTISRCGR